MTTEDDCGRCSEHPELGLHERTDECRRFITLAFAIALGLESPDACNHPSATGIDQNFGEDKIWKCDVCGLEFRTVVENGIASDITVLPQTPEYLVPEGSDLEEL